MSACLMVGAVAMTLASAEFRLEWTHSVEKTGWYEEWQIVPGALRLTRAGVKGSGAGMEPGPDAVLQNGWWVWEPDLPSQPSLLIAASGATGDGWHLCDRAEKCLDLGDDPGQPIRLAPCD